MNVTVTHRFENLGRSGGKNEAAAPPWKRRPDGRVSSDVIGIDQGNGRVWKKFMRAPEVRRALQRAGFRATLSPGEWRRRGSEEPGRYFFAARAASIILQDVLMISRRAWRLLLAGIRCQGAKRVCVRAIMSPTAVS